VTVNVTEVPAQIADDPALELMDTDAVTTGSTTNGIVEALPVAELLLLQLALVVAYTCTDFSCATDDAVVVKVDEVAPLTADPFIDH